MFKAIAKLTTILFLVTGLAACDNNKDQKEPVVSPPSVTAPPATVSPVAASPVTTPVTTPATTQAVNPVGDEIQISLLDGKVTMALPAAFADKTQEMGEVSDGNTQTLLLVNVAGKQMVIIATGNPLGVELLDTSDLSFDAIASGLMTGLGDQYQDIKKVDEQNLMIGSQKFRRFDTTQQVKGEQMLAATIFTVLDKQIILLQIVSSANDAASHNAVVSSLIDSIKIK